MKTIEQIVSEKEEIIKKADKAPLAAEANKYPTPPPVNVTVNNTPPVPEAQLLNNAMVAPLDPRGYQPYHKTIKDTELGQAVGRFVDRDISGPPEGQRGFTQTMITDPLSKSGVLEGAQKRIDDANWAGYEAVGEFMNRDIPGPPENQRGFFKTMIGDPLGKAHQSWVRGRQKERAKEATAAHNEKYGTAKEAMEFATGNFMVAPGADTSSSFDMRESIKEETPSESFNMTSEFNRNISDDDGYDMRQDSFRMVEEDDTYDMRQDAFRMTDEAGFNVAGDDVEVKAEVSAKESQPRKGSVISRPKLKEKQTLGQAVAEISTDQNLDWDVALTDMYAESNPLIPRSVIREIVKNAAARFDKNYSRSGGKQDGYANAVRKALDSDTRYEEKEAARKIAKSEREKKDNLNDIAYNDMEISNLVDGLRRVQSIVGKDVNKDFAKEMEKLKGQANSGNIEATGAAGDAGRKIRRFAMNQANAAVPLVFGAAGNNDLMLKLEKDNRGSQTYGTVKNLLRQELKRVFRERLKAKDKNLASRTKAAGSLDKLVDQWIAKENLTHPYNSRYLSTKKKSKKKK
jgi:hypothetical protein